MASIKATFWTFAKRDNSTKAPTSGGTELTISLKDLTNLLSPVIEIHYAEAFKFNYCYIDFTSRYYKITSFDSVAKDTYVVNCECDVLASWKSEILGQSVYAAYSSYDFNEWLEDNRITTGHNITTEKGTPHAPLVLKQPDNNGVVDMQGMLAAITDQGYLMGIDFIVDDGQDIAPLIRKFSDLTFIQSLKSGSPWDAVCEMYFVPFYMAYCIQESERQVGLDLWGIHFIADRIESFTPKHYKENIPIPSPTHLDFRFSEKYVKYYINVPYSGLVHIPTSMVLKAYNDSGGTGASAQVIYSADPFTGQFAAEVSVGGVSLGIFGANLKVTIQLGGRQSQSSVILRNTILGSGGAGAAALAGGAAVVSPAMAAAVGIGAVAGLIKGAVDIPPLESTGNYSGNAALPQINENIHEFYVIKVETDSNIDPATLAPIAGRPSQKVTTIQSGYIQTNNASVSVAGSPEEIRQINNLLNGGVYVE